MKELKTFLKLATPESNLAVSEDMFDLYQHLLKLVQRVCVQLILSKDVSSVLLMGVYTNEKCISLKIFGMFNLPKFTLNIYLFQFVSCSNNKAVDLFEISIGKYEDDEKVMFLIREAIFSKTSALSLGLYSEKLISEVLLEMKNEGKILSFYKSQTIDDIAGIDYYFCMRDYRNKAEEIPLQVKSSSAAQKYHEGKFSKIPSLVVSVQTSLGDLKSKIYKIGEAYISYRKNILHL